jgi:exodeoxyribonuclease VIII
VLCRAKADWLRPDGIVDYKTCDRADVDSLTKTVHNFGYYIQAAFYLRGFAAVLPVEVPFFAFVAQEKEPPYLVQVFQLTERALAYGDRKCAEALATYARCIEADEWPGYPTDDIPEIDLPSWVRTEEY